MTTYAGSLLPSAVDYSLDSIEKIFKNKVMRDSQQREEIVKYAMTINSINYVELFDIAVKWMDTPELHSKKRRMIIDAYRKYIDEQSESYVIIRDDWRDYMSKIIVRLEQDEKSTSIEENQIVMDMILKISVSKLMNLFANYSWNGNQKRNSERLDSSSLKRSASMSTRLLSIGSKITKKSSLVDIVFRK